MNDWKYNKNLNQKQKRSGKKSEIEDVPLEWFSKKRARNVPMIGLLFQHKAEDLSRQFKIKDFKPTNGWLYGCKKPNLFLQKKIMVKQVI